MKTLKTLTITSLIALSLQSCFVAKDYERPNEAVLSDTSYRSIAPIADSSSIASLSWKELFTDPLLVGHIETGLANNIDLQIALQQMDAAQAYYQQGKAGYLPSLSLQAQVTHQELSKNSQFGALFDGNVTQYDFTGTLGWEADIWGKIRSSKRAAQAGFLQTTAARQAVQTRLVSSIASLYFQLLTLDTQKELLERTVANRTHSLETTKALKEAGIVTEVAVQQTQAQLLNAQGMLVDLDRDISLLENSFSILLGSEPKSIARASFEDQVLVPHLKTGYPAQLLSNRPDVAAAEYRLVEAFELTNVARSNLYPSVGLSVTGGFQSLELDQLLNANSLFATLVGNIVQPLFNRRQLKTQFEVAETQQEIAYLQFKQSLLTAAREVTDALYDYQAASEKEVLKVQELQALTRATRYAEDLLENGMANYLEVLTARESALNAEVQVTTTRLQQLLAVVELYRALGGGSE
ncbi:efflux transporter outer membrane subunit [uncultured Planktosalinus sp.]|uniref:efflux transporter outer membrane subunit n=1 Tax=uncultured Planktosalinus sp. TaxID=1810935 RepID=UPI0030DD8B49